MKNFLFPIMMLSATDYYLGQGGAFRKTKNFYVSFGQLTTIALYLKVTWLNIKELSSEGRCVNRTKSLSIAY